MEISGRLAQRTDWSLQVRQGHILVQDISMPRGKGWSSSNSPGLPREVSSIARGPHKVLLTRAVWGAAAALNGPWELGVRLHTWPPLADLRDSGSPVLKPDLEDKDGTRRGAKEEAL